MAGCGARLRRADRLRRAADYARVFRDGTRAGGRLLSVIVAPGAVAHARLGLAVSRRVGGAVQRNRAKRLTREIFRTMPRPAGLDIVVVPRSSLADVGQAAVAAEYRQLIDRLCRRLKSVRREKRTATSD